MADLQARCDNHRREVTIRALCLRLSTGSGSVTPEVLEAARRHRLHLVLAASLTPADCEPGVAAQAKHELIRAAALDAWHEQQTATMLSALAGAGVDAVVFKGAALAYMIYDAPHLRPRVDTDLLVRRASVDAAEQALHACGWTRAVEPGAELAGSQRHYTKSTPGHGEAHVDLHWKIANPHSFADAMTVDELLSRAIPIPALGGAARAASAVDALLLACVHRVAHHQDSLDLLWLWDIHLLVRRLSDDETHAFVTLARRTAMTSVCRRGIELAGQFFGTSGAADLATLLTGEHTDEPSARFIGGLPPARVLREDLSALPGWRARAQLISEHLFPPAAYMRSRYPRWPPVLLPFAYAARIALGAPKWLRRS
jgi:hypothetical protein